MKASDKAVMIKLIKQFIKDSNVCEDTQYEFVVNEVCDDGDTVLDIHNLVDFIESV